MTNLFPIADNLPSVLEDIWKRLGRGAADRRSPFHTPVVGSTDAQGHVQQRVMVLRNVNPASASIRFHTDFRSAKVAKAAAGRVAVLGYDAGAKIQIRANGAAAIVTEGPEVEAAWSATSPSGRRSYLTTNAPGTFSDVATSGLAEAITTRLPTLEETLPGRTNFCLLVVTLDMLEWLHLAHSGHRRAAFARDGADWYGHWLVP